MYVIFVPILAKRLRLPLETLMKYAVYHYLTMSTPMIENELDLPGDTIQKCSETLLAELQAENESTNTEVIIF